MGGWQALFPHWCLRCLGTYQQCLSAASHWHHVRITKPCSSALSKRAEQFKDPNEAVSWRPGKAAGWSHGWSLSTPLVWNCCSWNSLFTGPSVVMIQLSLLRGSSVDVTAWAMWFQATYRSPDCFRVLSELQNCSRLAYNLLLARVV